MHTDAPPSRCELLPAQVSAAALLFHLLLDSSSINFALRSNVGRVGFRHALMLSSRVWWLVSDVSGALPCRVISKLIGNPFIIYL